MNKGNWVGEMSGVSKGREIGDLGKLVKTRGQSGRRKRNRGAIMNTGKSDSTADYLI